MRSEARTICIDDAPRGQKRAYDGLDLLLIGGRRRKGQPKRPPMTTHLY